MASPARVKMRNSNISKRESGVGEGEEREG